MRKLRSAEESNTNPNQEINYEQTPKISFYEKSREERIKSNLERMQKLGLFDLSRKLKASSAPKRIQRRNLSPAKHSSPLQSSGPVRRSSRLQNATSVNYSKDGLEVDSMPEVYSEGHQNLLGNSKRSLKLSVNGHKKVGNRVYDPVNGKTCHQCRQKTLGYHTHCSECNLLRGQFCGYCLFNRYGDDVLEALENPNWICPPCRGICNCSFCRHAKGRAPTGQLYKKISRLGYKSVAHYLIETQHSQNTVEKDSVTAHQVTVRRSLPFSEMVKPSNIINNEIKPVMPQSEETIGDSQTKRSLLFLASEECCVNLESVEVKPEAHDHPGFAGPMNEGKRESVLGAEKENQLSGLGNLASDGQRKILTTPDGEAVPVKIEPENANNLGSELTCLNEKIFDVLQSVITNQEVKQEVGDCKNADSMVKVESCQKLKRAAELNPDSIGARLRQRRRLECAEI